MVFLHNNRTLTKSAIKTDDNIKMFEVIWDKNCDWEKKRRESQFLIYIYYVSVTMWRKIFWKPISLYNLKIFS